MKFERFFTENSDLESFTQWKKVDVRLKDEETGKVIYDVKGVCVPEKYSNVSVNILVGKYFRMTGVPNSVEPVNEKNLKGQDFPDWLRRRKPVSSSTPGPETHALQVFTRMAGFWTYWGWMYGYFDEEKDARAFFDESVFMLANQIAAPNTPQFFNSGIYWAYGYKGEPKGYWRVDPVTGECKPTDGQYEFPGVHACHLLGIGDHLFCPGGGNGIYDNVVIETRCFAQGGGCGSNFSTIRSKYEKLSNGSHATGLMSFLKVLDRSASVIKSGNSQRRSSKMNIVNIDHPEVEDFIDWKVKEEEKVDALITAGYSNHYEGEAYQTVSGQSSNNSMRIPNRFMEAVAKDEDWSLVARTTGESTKKVKARKLWEQIVKAAWRTGDPGVQYDDHHNDWNTCPADGRLTTTNPCSEYSFITDSSCNLASLNAQAFFDPSRNDEGISLGFDRDGFAYAAKHWATVLDITNSAAHLPSKAIAEGTFKYRSIGLGHTGIGAVLMQAGIPYDSDRACHIVASLTSLMTAAAYFRSAELAQSLGTFPRFQANKDQMLSVLSRHALLTAGKPIDLKTTYWIIGNVPGCSEMRDAAIALWDKVLVMGATYGFRNAFTTLIAPSGTIGLLLGCDTLAIEPDFSIVKFKKLSGGGTMKIVNESLSKALGNLGYAPDQIKDILAHVLGHNTLEGAPKINRESLLGLGISREDVDKMEKSLVGSTELRYVLSFQTLSDESKHDAVIEASDKNIFKRLFTKEDYVEANLWICGHGALEGAPHIRPEHLPVFDCANKSGSGKRFIRPEAHVKMMAAVIPFISGAISKTVNLPNTATEADVSGIYMMSFKEGVKCIALYRDGCKRSQPLNNPGDMSWWDDSASRANETVLRGQRKRPPKKRIGITQEFKIYSDSGEHKVWVQTGEYEDGQLCEIWIDVSKENTDFQRAMKWWARGVSNAIQYGQPLEEIAASFVLEEGGPSGRTDNPYITFCKSIPDLVFKFLSMEYLADFNWCRKKPPIHELRASHSQKLLTDIGKKYQASKKVFHRVDAPVLTVHVRSLDRCPICGSTNIIPFPCATCASCGATLGGCSP
jgi:ribonucleoside-diphosphate reductase alpha chain